MLFELKIYIFLDTNRKVNIPVKMMRISSMYNHQFSRYWHVANSAILARISHSPKLHIETTEKSLFAIFARSPNRLTIMNSQSKDYDLYSAVIRNSLISNGRYFLAPYSPSYRSPLFHSSNVNIGLTNLTTLHNNALMKAPMSIFHFHTIT